MMSRGDGVRGTPSAFSLRAGLTRRAPEAVGLSGPPGGYSVFKSRAAGAVVFGTIKEHSLSVKGDWRDLLDMVMSCANVASDG